MQRGKNNLICQFNIIAIQFNENGRPLVEPFEIGLTKGKFENIIK